MFAGTLLDTRTTGEPTRDLYHRGLLAVAHYIQDDATSVLAEFAVLTSSPSLLARHGRSDTEWITRYLELIGPDVADATNGPLLATTAAMGLVAAQNALIAIWAAGQPDSDLIAMTYTVLDQIDSVWPPTSREPNRQPRGV